MKPNSRGKILALLVILLAPIPSAAQDKQTTGEKPVPTAKLTPTMVPAAGSERPFAAMAGSWSGGGTLSLSNGSRERLRCRAHHSVSQSGRALALSIRCASDSYRFDLTSAIVHRRGRIYGRWNEASNGISGTVAGRVAGGRIRAVAKSNSFTAGLAITARGDRQSVTITPRETFISRVSIGLRKR